MIQPLQGQNDGSRAEGRPFPRPVHHPIRHPIHQVVIGDARDMRRLPDRSVHLIVTSPPYWQLKDYGDPRQIGFHDSYEEYVAALHKVWKECVRVLHAGCRMAINIGDQFARAEVYGRYRVIPIRDAIGRSCEKLGLDPMGAIIWQKVTTCNTSGGGAVMGSFPFPRNGILKLDYEFILIYKKPGTPPAIAREQKDAARLSTEEWNRFFYGHWNFPGARQEDHIAVFPEELPRRLIRMFTFPGETVLDPFLGSGTTAKAAAELGRSSIGYEINADFLPIIRKKLGASPQRDLFEEPRDIQVVVEKAPTPAGPPLLARDGAAERSADPGGYGSVVRRGDSRDREVYRRVIEVRGFRTVVLDGGEEVSLIGLVRNERSDAEGAQFLSRILRGHRVYLRADPAVGPGAGYLYLKNRTFVNARAIRAGVAGADTSRDYRCRRRFENHARSLAASNPSGETLSGPPDTPGSPSLP